MGRCSTPAARRRNKGRKDCRPWIPRFPVVPGARRPGWFTPMAPGSGFVMAASGCSMMIRMRDQTTAIEILRGEFRERSEQTMGRKTKTLRQRFDEVGYTVDENGCWNWKGLMRKNGYGSIGRHGKAHRASFELFFGPIPERMDVCHRCDNRRCVNPEHLFIGTRLDNMRDCKAKGRIARTQRFGESNPASKLTSNIVLAIREEYRHERGQQRRLAKKYGVTRSTIWLVVHRKKWRHVA